MTRLRIRGSGPGCVTLCTDMRPSGGRAVALAVLSKQKQASHHHWRVYPPVAALGPWPLTSRPMCVLRLRWGQGQTLTMSELNLPDN